MEGEKVLVKDFKRKKRAGGKMDSRYTGPYIILNKSKGLYKLMEVASDKVVRVNGAHLKAYKTPPESEEDTDKKGNVSLNSFCYFQIKMGYILVVYILWGVHVLL